MIGQESTSNQRLEVMGHRMLKIGMLKLVVIGFALTVSGCNSGQDITTDREQDAVMATQKKFENVPRSAWEKLASRKIYFGHQSVGKNILSGIEQVMLDNDKIKLKVVKYKDGLEITGPSFVHSKIGKNSYPDLKDKGFQEILDAKLAGKVDAALYKYCYVDIKRHTDIDKVFDNYKKNIEGLKKKYPDTVFMHITAPITILQTGPKAWIKKVMGKPVGGELDNKKRHEFREKLMAEYSGKDPVFDLYGYESTRPDGSRVSYKHKGETYYALAPEYTDDGSHLNTLGRKYVAENFLVFLAENIK